ncbi:hypothetical protein GCM10009837_64130 [Streptomyces durmitorensis]|uniref:Uncharacterized protein n=1 Tax=Streptomyces durmitorensis TaxID=319947 RepID=A0ABY4PVQ3_9ACTN|nr:hypothetical protein [Streptomyces durmitorensis]UQT57036.1 hypothetical protein M4V62_19075 [Streptomyces durmitorensis]
MTHTDGTSRSRTRDGFGIAAFVLVLLALAVGFFWVKGAWRTVIRESPNLIADWPGGAWAFGIMAGVVAVAGTYGGLRASAALQGTMTRRRIARRTATSVCWAVPLLLTLYVLSALPGRNCSSSSPTCREIDGAFPALLAYAITTAVLGWTVYRVSAAREEQRRAAQQTRLRKLRKKGKGKSRREAR